MITNYKLEGTPNSPVLLFSNSLGATMHMWDAVVPYLLPYFRILRYDTRGHGGSETTEEPYSVDLLGIDVIDLLNDLKIDKVAFCGLSMGGLIGQWLSIHHPQRILQLILCNTGAKIGEEQLWNERINLILNEGMQAIADRTMKVWFTDKFRENSAVPDQIKQQFLDCNPLGYTNCCAVVRDADFRESISKISVKTLVITGDEDPITTEEHANFLTTNINDARIEVLHARHLSATERPEKIANLLIDFLVGHSIKEKGMHVRRTVLGTEHVDRTIVNKNSFNDDFQELIAYVPWGSVWARPAMSKHNRSLITLAMLIPLNKEDEFKMHVRAAFNNGLTVAELKELILHSSIYCGFPAANEAYKLAEEVLHELGKEI
ncbi:3-oxoadipate enol-lactonase/4-carboxymuconolactone decarboxylase [Chryseobacterium rhizosphaerae]|uniref:bifunctional 3-oxoadipate enol-lactonase/4-carboxymuconolactone decarboxylase PcaDC n=1 Tax=Chryseobacterium rhizosphaerae TaxID=395937 RepID=UPI002856E67C|nr:3-oxoadipate enol-lactonase [Chryseobacterium rhizosphaerae]MDR6548159.1 3-oxoadipate enol-lactonase/4-carboxymuconolactone decarboxylase [Chryseobacterium rhizosphaerae]